MEKERAEEVYYDVETQLSADEVGGWSNIAAMRISVAVTWCASEKFRLWEEADAANLVSYLGSFSRNINFNGDRFDSAVLSRYGEVSELRRKSFDLLTKLKAILGHRLTLDSLAQATLGTGKTGDGLLALRWWKEGRIDELSEYCRQDVQVLVDIVAFARRNGFVKYTDRFGGVKQVPVSW